MKTTITHRHIISTILCLLFFTGMVKAQFSVDVVGGISYASSSILDTRSGNFGTFTSGYFVGIAPVYRLDEKTNLALEIQYSKKGYKAKELYNYERYYYVADYLDFLPGLQYKLNNYMEIGAGLNIGVLLEDYSAFVPVNKGIDPPQQGQGQQLFDTVAKPIDLGAYFLAGARYQGLLFFVRYNHGITRASSYYLKNDAGQLEDIIKVYNQNIQLGLSLNLSFEKE